MSELMSYGLTALFGCFIALTFFLNRIQTDLFPEEYEFALDPFWYVISVMFLGGTLVYFTFPSLPDMVHKLKYTQIILPFVFALLVYLSFLFELDMLGNIILLGASLVMSYMLPNDFVLVPDCLTFWQDRLVTAGILFIFSKGLGLLNGIGGIASLQFSAVMIVVAVLAHLGALPYLLGAIALAYLGAMVAFAFFNWPPEKLYLSNHAFEAIGFIMACFMLCAAQEFAEMPVLIAGAYIITEILFALYDRYMNNHKTDEFYMNTSYYQISNDGEYDLGICRGIMKLLFINGVLAIVQILASQQYALFIFAVLLDFWLLSIMSGKTEPQSVFSLTRWGFRSISGLLQKNKDSKQNKKKRK